MMRGQKIHQILETVLVSGVQLYNCMVLPPGHF